MEHDFEVTWEPHPTSRDIDVETHMCKNCGLTVESPQDEYPIFEYPVAIEAMTKEWLQMHGLATDCYAQFVTEVHES